jgi:TetR/AcrR family transcriptional regulator, transcriptional repressor for nem operon
VVRDTETPVREQVLFAAREMVQSKGYAGLSYRELAKQVGIKAASIYHYFPTKADLGAAVARRYWEDALAVLQAVAEESADPAAALAAYPELFRRALENGNRLCLCSFMSAEYDDLPERVRDEVQQFTDVQVTWLTTALSEAYDSPPAEVEARARSIYAAVAGAQLIARGRSDAAIYDHLIDGYRSAGLLPS